MSIYLSSQSWSEEELIAIQRNPALISSANADLIKKSKPKEKHIYLPDGGILYFASTQPKKFHEIKQIRRNTKAKIRLCDAIDVLHWFHSADETSRTYIGNAYEKAAAILDRIYNDLGYEKVVARIREQGYTPEKVIFGVNDTGTSFNKDYSEEPEFADSLHEKGVGRWPGVELGPVVDAQGGIKGFYSALHNMVERMRRNEQEPPDLSGTDDNIYLFFKFTPRREDIVIQSYYSEVPLENTITPEPCERDGVLTSFHFSRSRDDRVSKQDQKRSRYELGDDYIGKYSAQALGLECFFREAGIPQSLTVPFEHSSDPVDNNIVIATHHDVLSKKQTRKWLPKAVYREADIRKATRVNTVVNGSYQRLTNDSDAVILGDHFKKVARNYDDYFLDLFDLWCSLHVDKQLRVETFENTPFFVLNRPHPFKPASNGENTSIDWNSAAVENNFVAFLKEVNPKTDPWQAFILFNQFLHEKGFVKQEPRFLHIQLDPGDPKR